MDMLRSLLSVPGNQQRMIEKSPSYGADALIIDLEDSVPLDRKADARTLTREFIEGGRQGGITYVRVNSLDTGLSTTILMRSLGRGWPAFSIQKRIRPKRCARSTPNSRRWRASGVCPLDLSNSSSA